MKERVLKYIQKETNGKITDINEKKRAKENIQLTENMLPILQKLMIEAMGADNSVANEEWIKVIQEIIMLIDHLLTLRDLKGNAKDQSDLEPANVTAEQPQSEMIEKRNAGGKSRKRRSRKISTKGGKKSSKRRSRKVSKKGGKKSRKSRHLKVSKKKRSKSRHLKKVSKKGGKKSKKRRSRKH